MFKQVKLAGVLSAVLGACGSGGTADDRLGTIEGLTGSSASGSTLYGAQCASCHGTTGQGGSGPRIAGDDETATLDAMLSGPDEMPTFTTLTDQELADLAAYVSGM